MYMYIGTNTYSLLLGCGLLLRSSLFLRRGLLLRCLLRLGSRLGGRAKLVRSLNLDEGSIGNTTLQCLQKDCICPLLITHLGLHVLLDSLHGGTGAVLELRDGLDDSCFV